jgi:hypothetical protein
VLSRESQLENARIASKLDRTGMTLKQLWTNLKSEGLSKQSNVACTHFSPDVFNDAVASPISGGHRRISGDFGHYIGRGHDGLPPKFLKLILPEILPILTHIIIFIIMTSSYSSLWKIALAIYIPKPGGSGSISASTNQHTSCPFESSEMSFI